MASSAQNHVGTPTQRVGFKHTYRKSDDLKNSFTRPATTRDNRSLSGGSNETNNFQVGSFGPPMPGAFNVEMRSIAPTRSHTPQNDAGPLRIVRVPTEEDRSGAATSEARQAAVREAIAKEMKIKTGTENMLEALMTKNAKQTRDQRVKVEQELGTSNRKLAELQQKLEDEIQRAQTPTTPPSKRMSSYFRSSPRKKSEITEITEESIQTAEPDETETSPTVVFTEILQQLEVEGMPPDYYIERANKLVDLFKKNPTLKYDIAWSLFSGRVQLMLLSESTDVVAAGYRLTRHAIADRASLKTIRDLHTDELVTLSLVKKGKTLLEREQAVKFVRAFLDVKDGVEEISVAVVRSMVAIAEHHEDSLKDICVLTLAELLAKKPDLLIASNGMTTLTDTLAEGSFPAPEGLVASFLHLLDCPKQRQYLGNGREFEAMFAPFTDPLILNGNEEKLKTCAKGISAMMKTWPGYLTLAQNGAASLKSLIDSLVYPDTFTRDLIMELMFDILRIKPPSWSSSYLAGRRLTTYGRVSAMADPSMKRSSSDVAEGRFDLTLHFTTVILATLLRAGLLQALLNLLKFEEDSAMKRKATLLVTEVLKLAHHSLPRGMSAGIQVLGELLSPFDVPGMDYVASYTTMVYQIESVTRTANRQGGLSLRKNFDGEEVAVGPQAVERARYTATMDPKLFAQAVLDTGVPNHTNYTKWNWNLINSLIDGPLTNAKLLEESLRTSKFVKRLVGFYRPFKWRFSVIRNTRPNQRYVRTGCALMRALCQTPIGTQFLCENKLMRQIAECLAQIDPHSGLTSTAPLFDKHNMIDSLAAGYFAILGALSESAEGIQIMERWHIMNMFYHIVQLPRRPDLLRALLGGMDYSLDTHLRVMLSQALTAVQKDVRLFATKLLRKYAVGRMRYSAGLQNADSSQWAIKLVLTQLYDPDVEVCEVAVKILEEACDQPSHLEFVVKCRPALDHLGEIGAPLLLRFLSISTGYRYLSGLDYIHQEMDDWLLGRTDSYVAQVEASLARAYMDPGISQRGHYNEEPDDYNDSGLLPSHFYRELARTEEGCKLLLNSGHFHEFASTIRDFRLDDEETDSLTKVKGCMWAVGNIGSMEMGGPFLEESDIVRHIVRIAEGAEVMSVRGTACFTLGLISRTSHGFAMLTDCDWVVTTDASGRSQGLCIPRDPNRLCLTTKYVESIYERQPPKQHMDKYRAATTDLDPIRARILKLIVDMGNSVMYKKVATDLQVLKARHGTAFTSVKLFQKTLFILESHHYRLQARQFILDLFDKNVMRSIVLEEDTTEESASESDTG